jgi:hypothetical protein
MNLDRYPQIWEFGLLDEVIDLSKEYQFQKWTISREKKIVEIRGDGDEKEIHLKAENEVDNRKYFRWRKK